MLTLISMTNEAFTKVTAQLKKTKRFTDTSYGYMKMIYVDKKTHQEVVNDMNGAISKQALHKFVTSFTKAYLELKPVQGVIVNFSTDMPHHLADSVEAFFDTFKELDIDHDEIQSQFDDIKQHMKSRIKYLNGKYQKLSATTDSLDDTSSQDASPFRNQDVPALALDLMKVSTSPLSTSEIAYGILEALGLPEDKDYDRVVKPVYFVLNAMQKRGIVHVAGKTAGRGGGSTTLWQLA